MKTRARRTKVSQVCPYQILRMLIILSARTRHSLVRSVASERDAKSSKSLTQCILQQLDFASPDIPDSFRYRLADHVPWYPLCTSCVYTAGMGRGCSCFDGVQSLAHLEAVCQKLAAHKDFCIASGHDDERCDGCRVRLSESELLYLRCNCCMGVLSLYS